jgi:hypothetical protein
MDLSRFIVACGNTLAQQPVLLGDLVVQQALTYNFAPSTRATWETLPIEDIAESEPERPGEEGEFLEDSIAAWSGTDDETGTEPCGSFPPYFLVKQLRWGIRSPSSVRVQIVSCF